MLCLQTGVLSIGSAFLPSLWHRDPPLTALLLHECWLGFIWHVVVVVQSLSHGQLFVTWWTAAHQASLSFTVSRSLLKPRSIESMMPSNHLILCHPFSSCPHFSQPQGLFQWDDSLHQVAKVLSFSFSISPSNEYSGLISFRINWFDLFVVQGTLKSLLQHDSSKASIL